MGGSSSSEQGRDNEQHANNNSNDAKAAIGGSSSNKLSIILPGNLPKNNTEFRSNGTDVMSPGTRRRSQSVGTARPSVETVVVKTKRAATTLWTLLHAQKCVVIDKCPVPGCYEAKMLQLHIKTCNAEGNASTCTKRGCGQAQQLLAHYRKCRSSRLKQASEDDSNPIQSSSASSSVCLMCYMVARHAKHTLHSNGKALKLVKTGITGSSQHNGASSGNSIGNRLLCNPIRKPVSRKSVGAVTFDADTRIMIPPVTSPDSARKKMPPPPPRRRVPNFDEDVNSRVSSSAPSSVRRSRLVDFMPSMIIQERIIEEVSVDDEPVGIRVGARPRSVSCVNAEEMMTRRYDSSNVDNRPRSLSLGLPLPQLPTAMRLPSPRSNSESPRRCETIMEESDGNAVTEGCLDMEVDTDAKAPI